MGRLDNSCIPCQLGIVYILWLSPAGPRQPAACPSSVTPSMAWQTSYRSLLCAPYSLSFLAHLTAKSSFTGQPPAFLFASKSHKKSGDGDKRSQSPRLYRLSLRPPVQQETISKPNQTNKIAKKKIPISYRLSSWLIQVSKYHSFIRKYCHIKSLSALVLA